MTYDTNPPTQLMLAPDSLTFRKYRLREVRADGKFHDHIVERRLTYLGSAVDCDVVIESKTVSRHHAKIEIDRNGHKIRDLESKNGLFVNGIRVIEAYLPREATIRFGASELLFNIEDSTVEVALARDGRFGGMIGDSLEMREIFALLAKIAPTDVTALVEGESGTGKELVAEALHSHSKRASQPFVIFDCSAVPEELMESELFGHVKGAFTGATSDRIGALQEAHGGTLFIDEIGELSLEMQPKLLRALEKREVKPVGSNRRNQVDVRIIAATNRNLAKEVQAGNFREDLYFRLAVIKIVLPPLRHRAGDIPILINHFLQTLSGGDSTARVSYETMTKLQRHQWPGNVRELRNYIERAMLLSDGGKLETRFIHTPFAHGDNNAKDAVPGADDETESSVRVNYNLPFKDAKMRMIDSFENVYWRRLLSDCGGNISEAARRGGIHRKSLEYLLKKLDISAKDAGT
ncbi:MAG: sigma 54-interacting transcriptional regulator [Myxococcales bacterium]|nr:sigma 54-interacting transcriptional regulator [Myxococcales bacterium]